MMQKIRGASYSIRDENKWYMGKQYIGTLIENQFSLPPLPNLTAHYNITLDLTPIYTKISPS